MFAKAEILQVELSTMCNALCLNCHRTFGENYDQVNPLIPSKIKVDPTVFDNIMSSQSMTNLKEIEFCGTIDDPLMHPDFLQVLDIIANYRTDINITLHTNGSLRNEKFFEKLAFSLKRFKGHQVNWSIDGASQEINVIYRQKTDFNKILKNAKSFIDAGGKSIWQFLIFPWNKHQIEQARNIAKEYNFHRFDARDDRSGQDSWWIDGKEWKKDHNDDMDMLSKFSKEKYDEVKDQLPKHEIKKKKNLEDLPISCMAAKRKQWFISWDSRIWPCCFLSNGFFMSRNKEHMEKRLFENYGKDFNDLTKHSVDDILQHDFLTNDLEISFTNKFGETKLSKIKRCAETCGQKESN